MKRILTAILCAVMCGMTLRAQDSDAILTKIAESASRKLDCGFTEVRTPAGKPSVKLTGKLVFNPEGFLSMDYDADEYFEIDGNAMTIDRGGNRQVFDTSKNLLMRGLSHTLIYSFQGVPGKLAGEQKAGIGAEKKGSEYVVTLTATKKAARGYSCIEIRYDAATCAIRTMRMDEFNGMSTYYELN